MASNVEKRHNAEKRYNENNVQFALQGDVLGCLSWHVGLNPAEMEEWAKRTKDPVGPLVEFVRKVNDPDFIPVDDMWRGACHGVAPVMWVVGKENTRVIRAHYNASYMSLETKDDPEGIRAKFLEALGDLAPDELDVTVDLHGIKVRMWWNS